MTRKIHARLNILFFLRPTQFVQYNEKLIHNFSRVAFQRGGGGVRVHCNFPNMVEYFPKVADRA